jgi:hypothetical protein
VTARGAAKILDFGLAQVTLEATRALDPSEATKDVGVGPEHSDQSRVCARSFNYSISQFPNF